MGEPKAFASLSSGLLARKGGARPAMRPQGFGGQHGAGLEDLGWNDMGFEPPRPASLPETDSEHDGFGEDIGPQPLRHPLAALTPIGQISGIGSPVHDQREELAAAFNAVEAEGDEDYDETAEVFEGEMPAFPTGVDSADVVSIPTRKVMAIEPVAHVAANEPAPVAVPAPRRSSRPRALPGSKAKAAFTLRLDKDRHLRLRLACVVTGRSAQQIVTDALDTLLSAMPEIDSMADVAPGKHRANH